MNCVVVAIFFYSLLVGAKQGTRSISRKEFWLRNIFLMSFHKKGLFPFFLPVSNSNDDIDFSILTDPFVPFATTSSFLVFITSLSYSIAIRDLGLLCCDSGSQVINLFLRKS